MKILLKIEIPVNNVKTFTCSDKVINGTQNGFITSFKYPSYTLGQNCELEINPPSEFGYKFYIIDVALSEK